MAFTKEQHREHRRRRVAAGYCGGCLVRKATPGMKTCQHCRDRTNANLKKAKARWRADPTRCGTCGGPIEPGRKTSEHSYCKKCAAAHKRYLKRVHEERIAKNLCVDCGRPNHPDTTIKTGNKLDYVRCPVCCERRVRNVHMRGGR